MGTPAEEFGPYVVYEQIGLGGMATVHRAETQGIAGFSKQVALKRMLPSVAADASLVQSFIREARLASHLRHANVAQTYDLGKVGETYFIAMELVPGRNLREILKHCAAVIGHMPMPVAMNIVNQICDALDYAHNLCDESGQPLGIIHRDVSPSNIIVSEGGVVKLIDFGIAKASGRGMNTMSGTIKGKFGYMAPEYLMGSIDARADLFALGVIAHELLANRPLFQGKDDMDTLFRVKEMPILPPSRINPKVPAEIDAIIMTALERDPDQRWQHAHALRMALTTETKRLGLVAHDSQVEEWIEWAFGQNSSDFDVDSEPVISISEGTTELPAGSSPGSAQPSPHVTDQFSDNDGLETVIRATGSKPKSASRLPSSDWKVSTEVTKPESQSVDGWTGDDTAMLPDDERTEARRERSAPTRTPARLSSPHVVARPAQRNTPRPEVEPYARSERPTMPPPTRNTPQSMAARNERSSAHVIPRAALDPRSGSQPAPRPEAALGRDEDFITTAPDRQRSTDSRNDDNARTLPRTSHVADDDNARTLPPALARVLADDDNARTLPPPPVRSTPNQKTMIADARSAGAPVAATNNIGRATAVGPGLPPVRTLPGVAASAGSRAGIALPRPSELGSAPLDDLAARGERPSVAKLAADQQAPAGSIARTRVEPSTGGGASNFLLAVLVLISAGVAAAVVYFVLPYLA